MFVIGFQSVGRQKRIVCLFDSFCAASTSWRKTQGQVRWGLISHSLFWCVAIVEMSLAIYFSIQQVYADQRSNFNFFAAGICLGMVFARNWKALSSQFLFFSKIFFSVMSGLIVLCSLKSIDSDNRAILYRSARSIVIFSLTVSVLLTALVIKSNMQSEVVLCFSCYLYSILDS